ncbi:melanocortin receptor 5-like [Orbicella faveolata]|uniref:melanocortin receptor 5-like n=1 Tax=Orbicella faveolata TaxID=48498 RepID=UPI0009E1C84E|nr:melanocortin receptor 5-like [Orbicella faveolata]
MNNSLCKAKLPNSSSTALQVKDPLYSATIVNIVFNSCLCYTTIVLNIVTICALRKTSSLPNLFKTLLLSLAVSDLGVGLLGQPLYLAYLDVKLQCNLSNRPILVASTRVILNIFYLSSFCSVMALSADRFFAIQKPLRCQNVVTHKRVITVVTAIWSLSVLLGLFFVFVLPGKITIVIILMIESVCFGATTWSSYKICKTARQHNIQIQSQTRINSGMLNIVSLRKSAQSTLFIYVAFWVCYLPHFILSCHLIYAGGTMTSSTLNEFFKTLVLLNSSLNPVIYCWRIRNIRHAIMETLQNVRWRQFCGR